MGAVFDASSTTEHGDSRELVRALDGALLAGDLRAARRHLARLQVALQPLTMVPTRTSLLCGPISLTPQERSVLHLLPDGALSRKDIAAILGVRHNTVKTHLRTLFQKLGVSTRSEAIARGRDLDLL